MSFEVRVLERDKKEFAVSIVKQCKETWVVYISLLCILILERAYVATLFDSFGKPQII